MKIGVIKMLVNQSTHLLNQTLSPIEPSRVPESFCTESDTILDLTFEEWTRIEQKIVPSIGFLLYREGMENSSISLKLPEFSYTESQGLKKWMRSLTIPRNMASFIFGYRQPYEDKPEDYQRLSACYRDIFSLMKRATSLMLSSLAEYFAFLSAQKKTNRNEQNAISCLKSNVHNATLEEWDSIYKNSKIFAKWVMADISRPKGELSMRRCPDCNYIELPLLSPRAHDGLEKWGEIVSSTQNLAQVISTKEDPCYFEGVQKMNQILNVFIKIVDYRLRFFANREFNKDQVVVDQMFPHSRSQRQKWQYLNHGINRCPLTKQSVETCVEEKESLKAKLKGAYQALQVAQIGLNQYQRHSRENGEGCSVESQETKNREEACRIDLSICNLRLIDQKEKTNQIQAALDPCNTFQATAQARLEKMHEQQRQALKEGSKCKEAFDALQVDLENANKERDKFKEALNTLEVELARANKAAAKCMADSKIHLAELTYEEGIKKAYQKELASFQIKLINSKANIDRVTAAWNQAKDEVTECRRGLSERGASGSKSCPNATQVVMKCPEWDDCNKELQRAKTKILGLEQSWSLAKTGG